MIFVDLILENNDGSKITKLFIGSVPRTATEQEVRFFCQCFDKKIENKYFHLFLDFTLLRLSYVLD